MKLESALTSKRWIWWQSKAWTTNIEYSTHRFEMRKMITNVFNEYGLSITLFINLKKVFFLDVTLHLEKEIYKPYRKQGIGHCMWTVSQTTPTDHQEHTCRNRKKTGSKFLQWRGSWGCTWLPKGIREVWVFLQTGLQPASKTCSKAWKERRKQESHMVQLRCWHKCCQGVFRIDR